MFLSACTDESWNNPYPSEQANANILYTAFSERPKHLDPARSYSSNEWNLIQQIYEPPLQYHYLKRPFELIPLTAAKMPQVKFYDASGNVLPSTAAMEQIAVSEYTIKIQPGILFSSHPAFAKDENGNYFYHSFNEDFIAENDIYSINDFKATGTRELTAEDYVYQIKRLANPKINSPIYSIMAERIIGLKELNSQIDRLQSLGKDLHEYHYLKDLRQLPLKGVDIIDKYTYVIKIKGVYPQFKYWLAMPFFSPMPWEVDKFFAQPGMSEENLSLDWYPIGTGPYKLIKNNPNSQIILERNENFRDEYYPDVGEAEDKINGLLQDAGKKLPFINKIIFNLEKESIPYWNKFLQGYYDKAGIGSDSFDQAVQVGIDGAVSLTSVMEEKGIKLQTSIAPTTMYWGFNMLDPVVGGDSAKAKKLRQAISIALDMEEYIAIFLNGRGVAAQGPIPPGIRGYKLGEDGFNQAVYYKSGGNVVRKAITTAKKLLAEAGYPDGIDQATGEQLVLHFDTTISSGPDSKATLDWMRKQFNKLNIELNVRATQYNRFQEKMRNGNAQIFMWGWHADYPDAENFLFLLYGKNGKVKHGGENAANYDNPEFNKLFLQMKDMEDSAKRDAIIKNMYDILQQDSPWIWGFHPQDFSLLHSWNYNSKPNEISRNSLKYFRIDSDIRKQLRLQWNKPVILPLIVTFFILIAMVIPAVISYKHKEESKIK